MMRLAPRGVRGRFPQITHFRQIRPLTVLRNPARARHLDGGSSTRASPHQPDLIVRSGLPSTAG
jgi:hypothetical protein